MRRAQLRQATEQMGADHNLLVRDKFSVPVHCIVAHFLVVGLRMYRKERMTFFQNGVGHPSGKPQGTMQLATYLSFWKIHRISTIC